jgi:hypothetical protein
MTLRFFLGVNLAWTLVGGPMGAIAKPPAKCTVPPRQSVTVPVGQHATTLQVRQTLEPAPAVAAR